VALENARTGAGDWQLQLAARDGADGEIAGYARASSVAPGAPIEVAVTSSVASTASWVLYRLGWYGGSSAREVARGTGLSVAPQAACTPAAGTGLVECAWPVALRIPTDPAWPSGAYLVRLTRADGLQRFVPVVLRASRGAAVRMILPTATWQAYNTWGGASLYDVAAAYAPLLTPRVHAVLVSYDRPYFRDGGAGHLLRSDLALLRWLEAQGIDVEYVTDEDVDRDPAVFSGAKVVVVSGHDEYWSGPTRDRVEAAVASGTSLLNMGANDGYWQIRYAPASADPARDRRIVVGYKEYALPSAGWAGDPVGASSSALTVRFRDPQVSRPENALFGVMFAGLFNEMAFPAVVTAPSHWALAGTGLAAGDAIAYAHGPETDDLMDNGATPPGVEVLASSTGLRQTGGVGGGKTVIRKQGAAWVFSSGGIGFANTLSDPNRADPRAQRLVLNVLSAMLRAPPPASPVVFTASRVPATSGFARSVATVATGLGAPLALAILPAGRGLAVSDTRGGRVLQVSPAGQVAVLASGLVHGAAVAADGAGNVYAADAGTGSVLRVDAGSGAVSQVAGPWVSPMGLTVAGGVLWVADAGAGTLVAVDPATGATRTACSGLYLPTGVAVAADGTVYVIETGNRRVVRVQADGSFSKVAGGPEGFRDGPAATALLLPMYGILALPDGSLVVADPGNYRLRRISAGAVTTLAGSGHAGARDGPGMDADLVLPAGLALGGDGTIYVAEAGSGSVRAITP
jgi:sugar lactone lactonase YvrE